MSHFECPCVSPGFRGALPAQWVLLAKGLLGIELLLKDLQWLETSNTQPCSLLAAFRSCAGIEEWRALRSAPPEAMGLSDGSRDRTPSQVESRALVID